MKRVLVYSHDTYGLGNIRRMLAISEHLCSVHPDLSILIVTGSPMLHAFRLSPRIDYVKLPCLTRTSQGDYQVKSLGLSYKATMAMRRQILRSTVEQFEPDLILVDKKPFGVDEELKEALDDARSRAGGPKLVLMLRDILDNPATTCRIWTKNNYYQAIETHFDSVMVLGTAEVFDLPTEYRFPPAAAALVDFCGYVGRSLPNSGGKSAASGADPRIELSIDQATPLVLVTPGGGEDGAAIIDNYLTALADAPQQRFTSVVVTGPEMPEAAHRRAVAVSDGRPDLRVLEFTADMAGLMSTSDLVVSMAGYNTLCEILSAGRPAVVVPRVEPVEEQLIRARLFAERGLVTVIHPAELTPGRLLAAVDEELARSESKPLRHRRELDMQGLERVEKSLAGLIGDA